MRKAIPWGIVTGVCLLHACIPDRKPIARLPESTASPTRSEDGGKRPDADEEKPAPPVIEPPRPTLAPTVNDGQLAALKAGCSEGGVHADCLRAGDNLVQKGSADLAFVYYDLACQKFLEKGMDPSGATSGCQEARNLAPDTRKAEYAVLACYTNNASDHCLDLCANEVGFESFAKFREQPAFWPGTETPLGGSNLFPSHDAANLTCLVESASWIPSDKRSLIPDWRTNCASATQTTKCAEVASVIDAASQTLTGGTAQTAYKCAAWYAERACLRGSDAFTNCAKAARIYAGHIASPFEAPLALRSARLGCLTSLTDSAKSATTGLRSPWRSFAGRSLTEYKCSAEGLRYDQEEFNRACPKIRAHMKALTQ